MLYKINEYIQIPRSHNATAFSDLRAGADSWLVLKRHGGFVKTWRVHGEGREGGAGVLVSSARQHKGRIEWKDGSAQLTAVDKPVENGESLVVLVPLGKKRMDQLIAVWVARVHQDTPKEGLKEEAEDEKRRTREQKIQDAAEGNPSGVLHDCEGSVRAAIVRANMLTSEGMAGYRAWTKARS